MSMNKTKFTIGIDEVGRGPLAGPVCVCACMIREQDKKKVARKLAGIKDSRKLNPKTRAEFYAKIKELRNLGLLDFQFSYVGAKHIDERGIVPAIKLAMKRSLDRLCLTDFDKCRLLLDGGLYAPEKYLHQKTIIKGDEKEWIISAASIIAKEERDAKMKRLAKKYPEYDFARHKGYGTKVHRESLREHGLCREHRRSFCGNLILK